MQLRHSLVPAVCCLSFQRMNLVILPHFGHAMLSFNSTRWPLLNVTISGFIALLPQIHGPPCPE